ncbi:MAG: hypothetical protein RLZ12_220 [Bacillota bacterium]|jgi:small subunit ribosomal protein S20
MANIKSAIKRAETNEIRRQRNVAKRSFLRTTLKKCLVALESEDENQLSSLKVALCALDKAASAGIIHKNCAARKKSRLTKKFKQKNMQVI